MSTRGQSGSRSDLGWFHAAASKTFSWMASRWSKVGTVSRSRPTQQLSVRSLARSFSYSLTQALTLSLTHSTGRPAVRSVNETLAETPPLPVTPDILLARFSAAKHFQVPYHIIAATSLMQQQQQHQPQPPPQAAVRAGGDSSSQPASRPRIRERINHTSTA